MYRDQEAQVIPISIYLQSSKYLHTRVYKITTLVYTIHGLHTKLTLNTIQNLAYINIQL